MDSNLQRFRASVFKTDPFPIRIISMVPTIGIEPISCRLQRLVLTTITTLAWRADLDSNEDDQFWRLSG